MLPKTEFLYCMCRNKKTARERTLTRRKGKIPYLHTTGKNEKCQGVKFMICDLCNNEIQPLDHYLTVGNQTICESCVDNGMEEYDPDVDYIDMQVNEAIERKLGIA